MGIKHVGAVVSLYTDPYDVYISMAHVHIFINFGLYQKVGARSYLFFIGWHTLKGIICVHMPASFPSARKNQRHETGHNIWAICAFYY